MNSFLLAVNICSSKSYDVSRQFAFLCFVFFAQIKWSCITAFSHAHNAVPELKHVRTCFMIFHGLGLEVDF